MKKPCYPVQAQNFNSVGCNFLNRVELPLGEYASLPEQKVERKKSFSEMYNEYKKNKEASSQTLMQKLEEKSPQSVEASKPSLHPEERFH